MARYYIRTLVFHFSRRVRCYGDNRCRWQCAQNKTQLNETMKEHWALTSSRHRCHYHHHHTAHTHTHAKRRKRAPALLHIYTDIQMHTLAPAFHILEDNWHLLRRVSPQITTPLDLTAWLLKWRLAAECAGVSWQRCNAIPRSFRAPSALSTAKVCRRLCGEACANTLIPEGCSDSG